MHIAIDSGAYMTVESAVTALLVRLKTLKSTATATLAQQIVLEGLPQLFFTTARPVMIPVLNPQPSPMALKLPRLADWAPPSSSSSASVLSDDQCIAI
ncbi:hypothetical protein SPRG_19508 [Saprolegnia parasitica CBS 223.65]|uniref:Uncharacterized protein n=1 Tax=Saprolegnia parasitica (strain CBS 223.65) TaxID=695850 RepID=A0A067CQU4_SAPPC|nr:hypothetical protein SPRG_19508 [Saprolegnia parasitica CBS 223.65]KDO31605.1 hypothetical protein SPRG_19508 [Saprolegnia parasitica CBS 223.65]|eukprot:XP_012197762.1 hypothetical protein SPRG_19508 [Saprolegnia parasitica CBS 223.65]